MDRELNLLAQKLAQATEPEEIFGAVGQTGEEQAAGLKKAYHQLAKLTHPDCFRSGEDQAVAQVAFPRLVGWFARAEEKRKAGLYGVSDRSLVLRTKKREYRLNGAYHQRGIYACYPGVYEENGLNFPITIKLVCDSSNNDLAQNEAAALQTLANGKSARKFWPYVPRLLDSFLYEVDGVDYQANVFERAQGWYSLVAVRKAYPDELDPRDMAWMWRRLLVALGFAHINGLLHGAVLPENVSILPEKHGLMLAEWSFSLSNAWVSDLTLSAIDPAYASWYPPEVHARETPVPGTDITMAARCMIYLLGGDPMTGACPDTVPFFLRSFFKGCTLPDKKARPQDAWALLEEFDDLIRRYWGERKFRPFVINPTL